MLGVKQIVSYIQKHLWGHAYMVKNGSCVSLVDRQLSSNPCLAAGGGSLTLSTGVPLTSSGGLKPRTANLYPRKHPVNLPAASTLKARPSRPDY